MPHMVRDKRQIETIRRTLEHLSKRQNINVFNVVCSEIYCQERVKSDKNNIFFLDFKINPKQALNDKETDYEPASIKNFEAPLDDVIGQVGSKFISANQVPFLTFVISNESILTFSTSSRCNITSTFSYCSYKFLL